MLYYLQSRYYDPQLGRFINADAYASTDQGILGNNMFAYCGNNPVNRSDPSGYLCINTPAMGPGYLIFKWLQNKKKIIEENYSHNSAVDANADTSTHNKLINDQNGDTGNNFKYGNHNAWYNACETIAIHNAKVLLGIDSTLSQTMYDCQIFGTMPLEGCLGTNPYALGKVFDYYGMEYTSVGFSEINQVGVYVISFWNEGGLFAGLHTVAVAYDGTNYITYNLSGNGNAYPGLPNCENSFICGYYLGGQP